ncbi:glycosyltransferase family 2 protein [bacterium]|nr:glycosyltransferase family 2 protein [bacterium]
MVTSATTTDISPDEKLKPADKASLSIIIPCYNSAASIAELIDETTVAMQAHDLEWEAILVNDGSRDQTWNEIKKIAACNPRVKGINLARNFGQHNALFAGIMAAANEFVVTIDDDLQHPPAEIPKLLAEARKGYDLVYGIPQEDQHGHFRNLTSLGMKYILEKSLDVHLASDTSAFRLFRRDLREAFRSYIGPFVDIDAILFWGTQRVGTMTVDHRRRKYGDSNYSLTSLIGHTIKMVVSFSQVPLRISAMIGFLFLMFGSLLTLYVIANYFLYDSNIEGFTFITVIILLFSGAQLFAIGIVGEYVGRLHLRSMGQPVFMVRETTFTAD